ncbi:competence protein CoiA family protein [Cryobacterium breve]
MSDGGGHSRESIFHSQGCALVEEWLRREFPNSHVQREEYTNELGERRADVLLTGPAGDRVAFEIQYSPITPDAWRNRHESYRRQHIADVWLFGHTGKQLQAPPRRHCVRQSHARSRC